MSIASGLLSSTPTIAFFAPQASIAQRTPFKNLSVISVMMRKSQVIYGSHSAPLTMR